MYAYIYVYICTQIPEQGGFSFGYCGKLLYAELHPSPPPPPPPSYTGRPFYSSTRRSLLMNIQLDCAAAAAASDLL